MLKYKIIIILSLIMFMSLISWSQQEKTEEEIEEIVVTANRVEQKSKELTDAHTIITRKDIEQSGSQTVDEILRNQAGIDIRKSGGAGRNTSIYMRGTNSDSGALILIDGVNVNDVNNNKYPDLQNLPLEGVERIEIIRGPQASLYGYTAIGGVINIITRKGKGKKSTLLAHTKAGSHEMHDLGIGIISQAQDYNFFFYSTYFDTDGYITPRDGAKTKTLIFSGTFKLTDLSKLSIFGLYTDSMVQLYKDGGTAYTEDYRSNSNNSIFGVSYKRLFWDFYEPEVRLNYKSFNSHTSSSFGPYVYITDAFTGSIQNNFYMAKRKNILSLGFEYTHEEYRTSFTGATGKGVSRNNKSIYVSNLFKYVPRLYITTSARIDVWDSTYDWEETFFNVKGGVAYHIIDNKYSFLSLVKVRSNISKVKSVASYNDIGYISNPADVESETYSSVDAGLDLYFMNDKVKLSATYFHYYIENFLYYDFTSFQVKNGGDGKIDGIELELKSRLPLGFRLRGAYTYTMLNINADDSRQLATRRPTHKGLANLNWNYIKPLNINVNWMIVGSRLDFDTTNSNNYVTLPAYHLVDAAISYKVIKYLTVFGKVNNLLDENYEDVKGFIADGRNFFVGTKLSIPID